MLNLWNRLPLVNYSTVNFADVSTVHLQKNYCPMEASSTKSLEIMESQKSQEAKNSQDKTQHDITNLKCE